MSSLGVVKKLIEFYGGVVVDKIDKYTTHIIAERVELLEMDRNLDPKALVNVIFPGLGELIRDVAECLPSLFFSYVKSLIFSF